MGKYNLFSDLKQPRDITGYTLFRGTTDFSQLKQFDLYETGFPYLIMVSMPKFLTAMAEADSEVKTIVDNYKAVVEREFVGFDSGIENIQSETQEISNGIQSVNVITKVNAPSATTFSMTYKEKAGTPLTKLHEIYLRSIADPGSTFKTYNGLITLDANNPFHPNLLSFDDECFSFLYMHTDNTGLLLERAVYFVCCQPTTANLDIYNGRKGDVNFSDISVEFNGFPLMGKQIDKKAVEILNWMNSEANNNQVQRNSWNYNYEAISDTNRLASSALTSNTGTIYTNR